MYYALSDEKTGDLPREHTHGFANTRCVIAFETRRARVEWLDTTRLMTARALTRAEAIRYADTATGMESGCDCGDKIARIHAIEHGNPCDADYEGPRHHVIRKSRRAH